MLIGSIATVAAFSLAGLRTYGAYREIRGSRARRRAIKADRHPVPR